MSRLDRWSAVILLVLMCSLIAACSDDDNGGTDSDGGPDLSQIQDSMPGDGSPDGPVATDSGDTDSAEPVDGSSDLASAVDLPTADAATPTPDAATPTPDAATPTPDAATPTPDAASPTPDAATPTPDAATPTPDAATPTPDVATPTPDAAIPTPDAATPTPDAATPTPDATTPTPDTAPTPDAATPTPDSAVTQPSWLDDTIQDCPALFSEVGLFPVPSDRSVVDGRMHYYEPAYPLWTDSAGKGRWAFIPAGATIDNSTRAWTYPDGTVFFKQFEYPGQPVETRILVKRGGSFEYCTYQWNAAGTEATLLNGSNAVPVTIVSQPQLDYMIPSESQCKDCHDKNTQPVGGNDLKVPIIGFDELRLNHTLPGQTQSQLEALAAQGLFSAAPPAQPEAVTGTAVAIEAKGWIHGNCAHCHNGGFKFDAHHSLVEASTINEPPNKPLISPQDPANSRLYISATVWDTPSVPNMPKIGVVAPDPDAQQILADWINSLP
jgi:hypothetical protein